MPQDKKPDFTNRLILVGVLLLAAVTIAGTIIATTSEWGVQESTPALEEPEPAEPDTD
ncbi:hypothetical protein [Pelagibacterium lentulum]|uniref:Uncharacterized protein n=1 Tax=Pelagibacterium lentulum TaxID=2029865 RepID=A0A916W118_9HYPH|nr:hypothetical protein [Pelagibacterium lentulum]GGA57528.1 hypothetical protein GCM10011499_29650 [Pelagibacterium lentulum]